MHLDPEVRLGACVNKIPAGLRYCFFLSFITTTSGFAITTHVARCALIQLPPFAAAAGAESAAASSLEEAGKPAAAAASEKEGPEARTPEAQQQKASTEQSRAVMSILNHVTFYEAQLAALQGRPTACTLHSS